MIDELPKSEHLILLVGGNPLPNAVAGKLLMQPGGTASLIHTSDTADTAERLKNWLIAQAQVNAVLKQVDGADPDSIRDGTRQRLCDVKTAAVGLHYTGGTKAMAVHTYRAAEQWAQERKIKPVYSYLDAQSLRMVLDLEKRSVPLSHVLQLRLIEDLMALHQWAVKSQPKTAPILPEIAKELLALHAANKLAAWHEWQEVELRGNCRRQDRPDKWLSKTALNKIMLSWPQTPELASLVNALQTELNQDDGGLYLATATTAAGFKSPEELCQQLNGGYWLESCVLQALQQLAPSHHLHDVSMGLRVPTIGDKDFELDVVAMRGYQLYGFSCGIDSDSVSGGRSHLKQKLFEAQVRAQQLGGDEARVALVSCADDPAGLQAEVRRDLAPHIRVFGRQDLPDLTTKLGDWIQRQGC